MEKSELQDLVRQAHAQFNQTLYSADEKTVFQAWWALLQDVPFAEATQTLNTYALLEKFMPTP